MGKRWNPQLKCSNCGKYIRYPREPTKKERKKHKLKENILFIAVCFSCGEMSTISL